MDGKEPALRRRLLGSVAGTALGLLLLAVAAQAQQQTGSQPVNGTQQSLMSYVSGDDDPPSFATPEEAVGALKSALSADDFDKVAQLFGLDPQKLADNDGVRDTYDQIREGAAERVVMKPDGDNEIVSIGDEFWPLPFPIVKGGDGRWAFDTIAGIEEIINRRIGENELAAIDTARGYVAAQNEYRSEDHDADGVLEYAQKLVSSPGQTDGLYWPADQGSGDSPAGAGLEQAELDKAQAGDGYYGYRFRILTRQGSNIAGGAYDYLINGNLLGGFALVARPVTYEETGVMTFVVNQNGIVYQKDLGNDTAALADAMTEFNPDDSWQIVPNSGLAPGP